MNAKKKSKLELLLESEYEDNKLDLPSFVDEGLEEFADYVDEDLEESEESEENGKTTSNND